MDGGGASVCVSILALASAVYRGIKAPSRGECAIMDLSWETEKRKEVGVRRRGDAYVQKVETISSSPRAETAVMFHRARFAFSLPPSHLKILQGATQMRDALMVPDRVCRCPELTSI